MNMPSRDMTSGPVPQTPAAELPLVTVVTCTLNAAKSLQRCIDSVRSQDYPHLQHLIIDGLSGDDSVAIARRNGLDVVCEKDLGVYDAFAKGVRLARGDIVHILGADDSFADPHVVSSAVTLLTSTAADVCHARIEVVDEKGTVFRTLGRHPATRSQLLKKMVVAHPTMFVRKSVYERFGSFYPCFRIAGDYDFCLRIWDKTRIVYSEAVWVRWEMGGLSTKNPRKAFAECVAVVALHGGSPLLASLRTTINYLKFRLLSLR